MWYGRRMLRPEEIIDNLPVRQRHGFRALHAKGRLYKATFRPSREAAEMTSAAHMHEQAVEATVRLSNGSSDPDSRDNRLDLRGLAVTFWLPDGRRTDIVCQTAPYFPTRSPDVFLEFLRLSVPGPSQPVRLLAFGAAHPRAVRALLALRPATTPPVSYATCRYHGIHAFCWIGRNGREHYVRYSWRPDAGVATLWPWEAWRKGPDYLQEDMADRLRRGRTVVFTLELQVVPRDKAHDPMAVPQRGPTVSAGVLEITGLTDGDGLCGDTLVFDPMRVIDGIEPSYDPILHFRRKVYEVSASRRGASNRCPGQP